jgi:hypothetical protein
MKKGLVLLGLNIFLISKVWAFPCYLTVVKGRCWVEDYDVNVTVQDASNQKTITTINVAKGKPWARASFECAPSQTLQYFATYSPSIWQNEDKSYKAKKYSVLDSEIDPTDVAWSLQICYPDDFSNVPLPPKAGADCSCDVKNIPEVQHHK